jgi:hypothetical protein
MSETTGVRNKSIPCAACGVALQLHSPHVLAAGCARCGGLTDVASGACLVQRASRRPEPLLPLGRTYTLRREPFKIIGFLHYASASEAPYAHEWREYQLAPVDPADAGAQEAGDDRLLEIEGHWSLVRIVKRVGWNAQNQTYRYQGREFRKHWEHPAHVIAAAGEFTRPVPTEARVQTYIAPPFALIRESTAAEAASASPQFQWKLAEYLSPEVIKDAFPRVELPAPQGVGMNQPCPVPVGKIVATILLFLVALLLVQLVLWGVKGASLDQRFVVRDNAPSPAFVLKHKTAQLWAHLDMGQLASGAAMFNLTLKNTKTGEIRKTGRIWEPHHWGSFSGSWVRAICDDTSSCSSGGVTLIFRDVPPGSWQLNLGASEESTKERLQMLDEIYKMTGMPNPKLGDKRGAIRVWQGDRHDHGILLNIVALLLFVGPIAGWVTSQKRLFEAHRQKMDEAMMDEMTEGESRRVRLLDSPTLWRRVYRIQIALCVLAFAYFAWVQYSGGSISDEYQKFLFNYPQEERVSAAPEP